jgi:hypothetical protein
MGVWSKIVKGQKMKIILKFSLFFLFVSILSYIFTNNFFLPMSAIFFLLLSSIIGIPMALEYPWATETHQLIIIFATISLGMMIFGMIKKKTHLGMIIFSLGFLSWSGIGLVFGLSIGT